MNAGLQPVKITVAAGAEAPVPVGVGRFFTVKEASAGTFEVSFDDGSFLPWDAGMAFAVPEDVEPFKLFTVRNTSGSDITFEIIVGAGRIYDQRLTVVASRVGDSLALDGQDGSGITAPADGVGIRGWLSGIYERLTNRLPATLGQKAKAASLAVTLASDSDALPLSANAATETTLAAASAKLPAALGATTRAGSLSVTDATFTGSIVTLQTDALGTNWATFAGAACRVLEIVNNTGTALEYRRGGAGASIQVASGASRKIEGIANANEISLRRVDLSNTQVTVTAEALT